MELTPNKLDELHLYLQAISSLHHCSVKGLLDDLNEFTALCLVTQKTDVLHPLENQTSPVI